MRQTAVTRLGSNTLRDLRAEFQRLFGMVSLAIATNRSEGFEIYEMYVDDTTNELVIVHEGGEKRIT